MKIKCLLVLSILIISSVFVSNAFALEKNFKSDFKANSDEYDMVIISKNIFKSTLEPLIEHKNFHGVKTYFKDVKEIYRQYSGRDRQEQIKYFIKDAIETKNISYVLIVGHILHVPMRKITDRGIRLEDDYVQLSVDLYYSDIYDENGNFCSWDINNNNLFGEYQRLGDDYYDNVTYNNIDELDLYADVHLGRIPCLFIKDLQIVVDKIIKYENSAYASDWFKKIILVGGDTAAIDSRWGEILTGIIGKQMEKHGFENIKLWHSKNNMRIICFNYQMSQGAGFMVYSGHGGTIGLQGDWPFAYFNHNLLGLRNKEKLPIVFFHACLTANPDLLVSPFAYNIVKKANGGAIAAIGATSLEYIGQNLTTAEPEREGAYLTVKFFENYEPQITVGEMLTNAQNDYLDDLFRDPMTIGEFILIGDPSLKVGGYP